MADRSCPICSEEAPFELVAGKFDMFDYNCATCGPFRITGKYSEMLRADTSRDRPRDAVRAAIARASGRGRPVVDALFVQDALDHE